MPGPSSESSGFLRPPAQVSPTGSFKVFAPPKPRLSGETGPKDPGASASELARPRPDDEAPPAAPPELAADATRPGTPALPSRPETTSDTSAEDRVPAAAPSGSTRGSLAERLASTLSDLDEPSAPDEELDEAEPIEELDEDEPTVAAAAPPRPKAPPPPPSGAFKPRPLLPIVPPSRPKK